MMTIKIESANKFGKLTSEKLFEFEQKHQLKLPDDYRSFLLEYNGGRPNPEIIDFIQYGRNQSDIVNYLCGIHSGEYWASLEWHMETLDDRISEGFVPFGYDPGGNVYLLGVIDEFLGKVYFWDHENEPMAYDKKPGFENISIIADSFSEFLNKLHAK